MDADEIVPLTSKAVARLIDDRCRTGPLRHPLRKRRQPRWPFPGTVQLWLRGPNGAEHHVLATCHNLSEAGISIRTDVELQTATHLPIAIHLPELSLHGRAVVRHCTAITSGYLVGLEFIFTEDAT